MAYAPSVVRRDAERSPGDLVSLKMAAEKIPEGVLVFADASAGYASGTASASRPFFGVSSETVDNSAGSAGDLSLRTYITGVFSFVAASADQTWVGKEVWASSGASGDNKTVVIADPGVGPKVGRVVEFVSATKVRVLITGYAFNVDAEAS